MCGKFFLVILFLHICFSFITKAQINCNGEQIFTEKRCSGDEISPLEIQLYKLVNDYRAENKLPPVPMSEALSIVGNRHLLDLILNIKGFTHSWSNCPYDIKDSKTWNCLFDAPKRLNVDYKGKGYENLYRNNGGNADPKTALEAWKKSKLHNDLILNLNSWSDVKYDAFGVAIQGQYAALWFGTKEGIRDNIRNQNPQGLGISLEKAIEGIADKILIKKVSSTVQSEQWTGISADKTIIFDIVGTEKDIWRAAFSVKIRLEKNTQISAKNQVILSIFLKNMFPDWKERDVWINQAIGKLRRNPKSIQTVTQANRTITVTVDANNFLVVTVKPFQKNEAIEIF